MKKRQTVVRLYSHINFSCSLTRQSSCALMNPFVKVLGFESIYHQAVKAQHPSPWSADLLKEWQSVLPLINCEQSSQCQTDPQVPRAERKDPERTSYRGPLQYADSLFDHSLLLWTRWALPTAGIWRARACSGWLGCKAQNTPFQWARD